jgi:hypothetical protein
MIYDFAERLDGVLFLLAGAPLKAELALIEE